MGDDALVFADAGPDIRASDERNPDEASHIDLLRAIKLHGTGVSIPAFGIVDRAVFPTSLALLRETGEENQPDDRPFPFRGVRIVDVCFILSFRRSWFPQRDNLSAQLPLIFENLKSSVVILPDPDRRNSVRADG